MQKILIVDEKDNVIGSSEKEYAIKHSQVRRISRIFVFNNNGELFIQKRKTGLTLSGGKWDQSAGGHVDVGETYKQAAERELKEELGIKAAKLKEIGKFYFRREHETFISKSFNTLFSCHYNGKITLQESEVDDGRWVMIDDLLVDIKNSPDLFAGVLITTIMFYNEHI